MVISPPDIHMFVVKSPLGIKYITSGLKNTFSSGCPLISCGAWLLYHPILSYYILSYHIIVYHIISYHLINYHITSHHIIISFRFWHVVNLIKHTMTYISIKITISNACSQWIFMTRHPHPLHARKWLPGWVPGSLPAAVGCRGAEKIWWFP